MKLQIQFTSKAARVHYSRESAYGSAFAAGMDLRAAIDAPMTILPSEQAFIPTGVKINLMGLTTKESDGAVRFAAIAMPRSGRGSRDGLVLGNTVGLIDQDYHGEIVLCCWARPTDGHINGGNFRVGGTPVRIEPWERIAQLVIVPVLRPEFEVVDGFSTATERGSGGFGSTGL
jgi:dUTP pyrophosphatase